MAHSTEGGYQVELSSPRADAAAGNGKGHSALMEEARGAYAQMDVAKSRAVHDVKNAAAAKEVHGGAGAEFIKSIVFGGLDGIITEFALVASVAGASLPIEVVLLTGVAKLIGDGLSMAIGDTMSESAEQQYIRGEREREEWEMKNNPEGEKAEMMEVYENKGFTPTEARRMVEILTKNENYKRYFIDHMMIQELDLLVPDADDNPIKNGVVTFISFIAFGLVPLLAYVIFWAAGYNSQAGQIGICAALTLLTLFVLGAVQAKLIKQSIWKQGILMAVNGGMAAGAAYLVGWGLQRALETDKVC